MFSLTRSLGLPQQERGQTRTVGAHTQRERFVLAVQRFACLPVQLLELVGAYILCLFALEIKIPVALRCLLHDASGASVMRINRSCRHIRELVAPASEACVQVRQRYCGERAHQHHGERREQNGER